jgi:hypothetical protein
MKSFSLVLILCLSCSSLFSQDKVIELSQYVFPEFSQGVVLMKSGVKTPALLNYNSLSEEIIFENNGQKLALGNTDQVDTVFIGIRKFVIMKNKFVELVHHSSFDLFVAHKCMVKTPGTPAGYGGTSQTSSSTSYSSLNSSGVNYNLKLPDGYQTSPYTEYWLKKNGEMKKFTTLRQLMKLYSNQKDICKEYVKQNKVKYENQESIIQLIRYLENNKN